MRLVILTLALIGFGCATKTVHEVCSNPANLSRFKDYDQCYAEVTKDRERKEARRNEPPLFNLPKTTNCTTTGTSSYGNYYDTTECN